MTVPITQRLRELNQEANRDRIHYAYLAEDYDGIGQYVLVALSRASTAAALKARVASGDFATGQVIPSGTVVSVFTYHGRLEVLSLGAK